MEQDRSRAARAWCFYDCANSAFATTIVAAVLPPFFAALASRTLPAHLATATWGYVSAAAMLLSAIVGIGAGAITDRLGRRKPLLFVLVLTGAIATALMAIVPAAGWRELLLLYILAFVAFATANVLYDSLLPSVAGPHELNRVSARGFAYGYLGGGVLLAINLAWILAPRRFGIPDVDAATRLSFVSVGVWWLAFSVPLFRRVPDRSPAGAGTAPDDATPAVAPPARADSIPRLVAASLRDLAHTLRTAGRYPDLLRFLLAYWLYSDGIGTIVRMSSIYGSEVGVGRAHLVGALLMVQIVAAPMSLVFGRLADRIGARAGVIVGLAGYALIPVYAYFVSRPRDFWILAGMVALFQGGTQALSRSLFATLVPRDRLGQMFGFYSVSEKIAGIVGPLLFGLVAQVSGSGRFGVFTLVPFFVGGALLLLTVNVGRGSGLALSHPRMVDGALGPP